MQNLNLILFIASLALSIPMLVFLLKPALKSRPGWKGWVETIDTLWVACTVALVFRVALVQPFKIPSASMENTLLVGDYILVNKFAYGFSWFNRTQRFLVPGRPRRGDIVVFVYPEDHTKDYIKRCVGLPGDVIEVRDKALYVNGSRQDEPWVKHSDFRVLKRGEAGGFDRDNFGPVTVAAGRYFMMGDNRDNSSDSRVWGTVDERLLKGRAWIIYWNSNNFRPNLRRVFHLPK
jgi:signal peptidase I